MSFTARVHEKIRNRLKRMVEKERQQIGCATRAVKNVAKRVYMSPASIYRTLNNYGDVKLSAVTQSAIIMHSVGIVKAAAGRMKSRRHATSIHA